MAWAFAGMGLEVFTPFIIVLDIIAKYMDNLYKSLPITTEYIIKSIEQYRDSSSEWLRNILPEWKIGVPWGEVTIGLKWIADIWWWVVECFKYFIQYFIMPIVTYPLTVLRNLIIAIHDFICIYIMPIYRYVVTGYVTIMGIRYLPRAVAWFRGDPLKLAIAGIVSFGAGLLSGEAWYWGLLSFGVCREMYVPKMIEKPIPYYETLTVSLRYNVLPQYVLYLKYPLKIPPYMYETYTRYAFSIWRPVVELTYSYSDTYMIRIYRYLYGYSYQYSPEYFMVITVGTPVILRYSESTLYSLFVGIGYPVPLSYTSSTGYRLSYSIYSTIPYVQRIPSPEVEIALTTQYTVSEAEKISESVSISPLLKYTTETIYSISITAS